MANSTTAKKPKNIYEKLSAARSAFANVGTKKSGVNLHASYKYYELEDIVPTATECFAKEKCMFLTTFPAGRAEGVLVDLENPEDKITVGFDVRPIAEPGKFRMNETQARGAEITYMRRYLYAIILDLVDQDKIDGGITAKAETPTITAKKETTKPTTPPTPKKREEIKEDLTGADKQADELQITALKAVLKDYKQISPEANAETQKVIVATKGLTDITKKQAEALIKLYSGKLNKSDVEEL